ncbi:DUF6884 domain-containing protein [Cedecea sp. P7760]|uniref:DUF6884 domain-containing protein n=1 Tax=Cedecea sp. P7760 TaxID=2726983 RepID=UPI0015A1CBE4|nr:DUF6884 domain-containing protein [Cedecea sp. P7760]NWC63963.1 hypothetical protein [Cedecea sp. P7760]
MSQIPGSVHLITTCTRRKTVSAGTTIFPAADDAASACESWQQILKLAIKLNPTIAAGELYTGQHWHRAAETARITGCERWVISAGLGLLHVTDPIIPYEATFAAMPFCHQALWAELTENPPTQRRCRSLQALMQDRKDDRFVIAASPVYLRAVEKDLAAGRDALSSPSQLTIVTSKAYKGSLQGSVEYVNAGMMRALNTNMTGLNISYALAVVEKYFSQALSGKNSHNGSPVFISD